MANRRLHLVQRVAECRGRACLRLSYRNFRNIKTKRRILAHKTGFDPRHRPWRDIAELQSETDLAVDRSVRRRGCPITGTSVWEAYEAERACLQPLPLVLPEPFDLVGQRRVAIDSTISFEGRSYSVPFRYADQVVEVRGCAGSVQVWAEGGECGGERHLDSNGPT